MNEAPDPAADKSSPRSLRETEAYRAEDIYEFTETYVDLTMARMPEVDKRAMHMILLLGRVSRLIFHDLESRAQRPMGVSSAAFYVAAIVWLSGPLESSKIATIGGMSRSAVSGLTKTLVRDGWVERSHSDSDLRAVVISLTPLGEERIRESFAAVNRRERLWAANLSDTEADQLTVLLAKLVAAEAPLT